MRLKAYKENDCYKVDVPNDMILDCYRVSDEFEFDLKIQILAQAIHDAIYNEVLKDALMRSFKDSETITEKYILHWADDCFGQKIPTISCDNCIVCGHDVCKDTYYYDINGGTVCESCMRYKCKVNNKDDDNGD